MDILLIAGLWLDGSAWDDVAAQLEARGHRAVPVTLPGQGDGNTSATLADQSPPWSRPSTRLPGSPWWWGIRLPAPWRGWPPTPGPARSARSHLIGGFPCSDGEAYVDSFFQVQDGVMPFPGWGQFEGPDSADLDDAAKRAIASAAIPVPEGVARGVITLADERRYDVPVVLICPEFSPAQAREWIDGGEVPELAKAKHVSITPTSTPVTGR